MEKDSNCCDDVSVNRPYQVVLDYFCWMDELREGDERAVGKIMSLWNEDGMLTLTGAPKAPDWPKNYNGQESIRGRYSHLLKSQDCTIHLAGANIDTALGGVRERIKSMSLKGSVVTATVVASLSTSQGPSLGFEIDGEFTFTLSGGRIMQIVENVDWSDAIDSRISRVKIGDLSMEDMGRLTLLAWAIA